MVKRKYLCYAFGFSTICGLAEKIFRGLVAGLLGLMLMTIGTDEIEGVKIYFGNVQMLQGVNLLVAMIGYIYSKFLTAEFV